MAEQLAESNLVIGLIREGWREERITWAVNASGWLPLTSRVREDLKIGKLDSVFTPLAGRHASFF